MISNPLSDVLGPLHGKLASDIYVLISKDGSTLVKDPGLDRPWSSTNKKVAEHMASELRRKDGVICYAITLADALPKVLYHPKNLPKGSGPLPDAPQ